ncbi:MAG: RidA family protein [Alphaproteobacteria bacterium]|nr:RidA family protein [Alphaproteobacteria bacterium]
MREIVTTPDAPPSSSPVSQATKSGGMVFIGGQMPRDPKTDKIVEGAEAQARCSMDHCLALLEAAGVGPDDVTLAIVYVTDLAAKPAVNSVFREAFGDKPPARNLVAVKEIGEGAIVEIGLIAVS